MEQTPNHSGLCEDEQYPHLQKDPSDLSSEPRFEPPSSIAFIRLPPRVILGIGILTEDKNMVTEALRKGGSSVSLGGRYPELGWESASRLAPWASECATSTQTVETPRPPHRRGRERRTPRPHLRRISVAGWWADLPDDTSAPHWKARAAAAAVCRVWVGIEARDVDEVNAALSALVAIYRAPASPQSRHTPSTPCDRAFPPTPLAATNSTAPSPPAAAVSVTDAQRAEATTAALRTATAVGHAVRREVVHGGPSPARRAGCMVIETLVRTLARACNAAEVAGTCLRFAAVCGRADVCTAVLTGWVDGQATGPTATTALDYADCLGMRVYAWAALGSSRSTCGALWAGGVRAPLWVCDATGDTALHAAVVAAMRHVECSSATGRGRGRGVALPATATTPTADGDPDIPPPAEDAGTPAAPAIPTAPAAPTGTAAAASPAPATAPLWRLRPAWVRRACGVIAWLGHRHAVRAADPLGGEPFWQGAADRCWYRRWLYQHNVTSATALIEAAACLSDAPARALLRAACEDVASWERYKGSRVTPGDARYIEVSGAGGLTPLMVAAAGGHVRVLDALLEALTKGAAVDVVGWRAWDGRTAYDMATLENVRGRLSAAVGCSTSGLVSLAAANGVSRTTKPPLTSRAALLESLKPESFADVILSTPDPHAVMRHLLEKGTVLLPLASTVTSGRIVTGRVAPLPCTTVVRWAFDVGFAAVGLDEAAIRDLPRAITTRCLVDAVGCLRVLAARWIDINIPDSDGLSPLDRCVQNCRSDSSTSAADRPKYRVLADALLCSGADMTRGVTPVLLEACRIEDLELVKILVAHRADLSARDAAGLTPLLSLRDTPTGLAIAMQLITAGADVNARDDHGRTALHTFIASERFGLASLVVAHGADVNMRDSDGRTPLVHAIVSCERDRDCVARVMPLIDAGADVNIRDAVGHSALHHACVRCDEALIKALACVNADVNAAVLHRRVWPPLMFLLDSVDPLVPQDMRTIATPPERGAPKSKDDRKSEKHSNNNNNNSTSTATAMGGTAVAAAAAASTTTASAVTDITVLLLSLGAAVNSRGWAHRSPLHIACERRDPVLVELLVLNNADVNATSADGSTPLVMWIEGMTADDAPAMRALVAMMDACHDFGIPGHRGVTALHAACEAPIPRLVDLLIARGANVDAKDFCGRTPLLVCAEHAFRTPSTAHLAAMRSLIAAGASLNEPDNQGHTPLFYARREGNIEMINLLRPFGALDILVDL